MQIIQIDPSEKRRAQQFLHLPFALYAHTPQWVPPLAGDAAKPLNKQKHPFYTYGQAAFYLALEGEKVIGRLAVLDNPNFNAFNHTRTAFFYLFECENNPQAATGLFEQAFAWAHGRGLTRIIGPKGFTVFDGMGLLVKGFEHRPAFGLPYNPPYYAALVEANGFAMDRDLVSGYLDYRMQFPEKVARAADLLMKRRGLRVATYQTRSDLKQLIPHLKTLYNSALTHSEGTVPLTDDDVKGLAQQMLWFMDPTLVKTVMKGDETVGFLLGYPDISAALQRNRGRLFPFGWLDILRELRRTPWINLNGAGMLEGYRGLGGTALLFYEMYKSVTSNPRYRYADLVQIGVENSNMQREMREYGIDFYKMHRLYQKMI
jgi:hypothetical protein